MPEFKDNKGRNWSVHVGCREIDAIREKLAKDLLDPAAFSAVVEDPVLCAKALAVCCGLDSADVREDDFASSIWGDVVAEAQQAMIEAVIRFFPNRARRERMTRAMREWMEARSAAELRASDGANSSTPAQASSE